MFDEYIRQGEPDKIEKSQIWQTAIGLQQVDGLTPSAYLIETAKENIEGKITIDEVKYRIDNYYNTPIVSDNNDDRTEEADKVSARITEILSEKTFSFSPIEYITIHKRLFTGIYKFAGQIRDYDISKKEWVLNGKSVVYAGASLLQEVLEHDFNQEKAFNYNGLTTREKVEHIAKFISNIWQAHAFGEGNTRTTAVFAIKYLRTFGFEVNNNAFEQNSYYFRNSLVRANFNDFKNNIVAHREYLNKFFYNLLLGEQNELESRNLHISLRADGVQSINKFGVKNGAMSEQCRSNDTDNITDVTNNVADRTSKIIALIKENNHISTAKMATILSVSKRTILRDIDKLKLSGQICREGGEKTGYWKINNNG